MRKISECTKLYEAKLRVFFDFSGVGAFVHFVFGGVLGRFLDELSCPFATQSEQEGRAR